MQEMNDILCLKWNNHASTFIQKFDYIRYKELYCDATLACNGKYYPVHRFVLSTCSEHFEEIFARTPCKHPFIIFNDIYPVQLEALLEYMYKGEVNILQENLPGLIKAAEALKVRGLGVHEEEIEPSSNITENKDSTPSSVDSEKDGDISGHSINNQGRNVSNEEAERLKNQGISDKDNQNSQTTSIIELHEDNSYSSEKETVEKDEIKEESLEEISEDKLKATNITLEETPSFLSLLNCDKELCNQDQSSSLSVPQCSSWSDSLQNSDTVNKENLELPWIHSSDYESSFPLDPLHYLSTSATHSSSYPSLSLNELPSLAFKDETNQPKPNSSQNAKNHKYQCEDCFFSTNDKAAFKLHVMRKHTGEKPFACSLCAYRCTTRDMLKIHTRKHTGEKPFSCPYCSCRMAVKSSLKRHIILKHIQARKSKAQAVLDSCIATGTTKPYKCNFCSYESQMKSNLKLHCMRIHTGEKPIACHLCPYRTTTKSQLEKHVRKHTGEKPFPCQFCTYKAAQKHSLLRHMALHTK